MLGQSCSQLLGNKAVFSDAHMQHKVKIEPHSPAKRVSDLKDLQHNQFEDNFELEPQPIEMTKSPVKIKQKRRKGTSTKKIPDSEGYKELGPEWQAKIDKQRVSKFDKIDEEQPQSHREDNEALVVEPKFIRRSTVKDDEGKLPRYEEAIKVVENLNAQEEEKGSYLTPMKQMIASILQNSPSPEIIDQYYD